MAKIGRPLLFSTHFGVAPSDLAKLGVFDPTLNVDTELFMDPLLLERSDHAEMRAARKTFEKHFGQVLGLIRGIQKEEDAPWKAAFKLLSFPEVDGFCLGYGADADSGSGSGPVMTLRLLNTGLEIIRLGIDDPDLFLAMGLFEKDFGPDLVGDMVTNVALGDILAFNRRILDKLDVPVQPFEFRLRNGKRYSGNLPRNPTIAGREVPVILVPTDVLRNLPIATSWSDVQAVAAENEAFRQDLNENVAHLWSKKTLESKERLKAWALSSHDAFGSLLDMLHGHDGKPYDFVGDPAGELIWRSIGERIIAALPLEIPKPERYDGKSVISIVELIIKQFQFLIEKKRLSEELWVKEKPRLEKSAQRLFLAVAYAYCEANGLDLTPEAETGRGPVDFKVSVGKPNRVLVEIKLSTNKQLIHGYEKQLAIYDEAEEALESYFVVLDVGHLNEKAKRLRELHNSTLALNGKAPKVIIIDGNRRPSASRA